MIYKLFGFFVRREACRLAALAMQGDFADGKVLPKLWSLAVFFEEYMLDGAEKTREDFGPKEPIELQVANQQKRP